MDSVLRTASLGSISPSDARYAGRNRIWVSLKNPLIRHLVVLGYASKKLAICPEGLSCKVRNMQVHDRDADLCEAGQRVALNLSNVKKSDLKRGSVIAPSGSMENTTLIDVKLSVLRDSRRSIRNSNRSRRRLGM